MVALYCAWQVQNIGPLNALAVAPLLQSFRRHNAEGKRPSGKFTVGLVLRERFEEGHQRVSVSASRGRSINRRHVYTSRHLAPRTPRPGWCRSSSSQPWGDTEADLSGEAYNACKTLNGIISARFFISLGWQINTHGLSATMHSLKPLVPPEPAGDSK